ncbi:hypothetical protein AGMMS50255_2900 [Spirochaetia bacterium]|nr:hypothetical protein AGMMS50255_2900 [Spirochaetia bacterium]
MKRVTLEQVIEMHNALIAETGGEELTKLGLGLAEGSIDEGAVIDWIVE